MKRQYFVHSNVLHCDNIQEYVLRSTIDAEVGQTANETFNNISQEVYNQFKVGEVTIVINSIQLLN